MQILKKKACAFIENYIKEHKMDFVWDKLKMADGSWMALTEEILKSAFSKNILESLEENDLRVEVIKRGDGEDLEESCLVEIKASPHQATKKNLNSAYLISVHLDFYMNPFSLNLISDDNKI